MYSTPIAPVLAISFSPAGISAWASPEILRWARSNSKQCGQPCRWPHVAAARSKTPDIARSGLLRRHTKRDGVPFPEAWVPDAEAGGHVHSTMMTIEPVDGHGVIVNSTARPSTPAYDHLRALGQWNPAWDRLYEMDPVYTERFMSMLSHSMYSGD